METMPTAAPGSRIIMPTDRPAILPNGTEVVVIGGGIAGVSTAWHLERMGVPVVLCEKGRIAAEQSSRNWGWVRKQGRDPRELPLSIRGLALWAEIAAGLEEDIGWHVGGVTYLIEDDADAARFEKWLGHAKAYQLDSRLLSKAETDAMLGANGLKHRGALITPSDGRAEPQKAVPAMARALRRRGVPIVESCAVRTIERQGGKVSAVVTEHGRITCNAVVLAGGVWSGTLLRHLGYHGLPQLHVISSAQRTTKAPLITESAVGSHAVSIRRRDDGGYTVARSGASRAEILPQNIRYARPYLPVLMRDWRKLKLRIGKPFIDALLEKSWDGDNESPFERTRVFDPVPDHRLLDEVLAAAKAAYPALAEVQPAERWAGAIDVLPDEVPALGPVPGIDGLIAATGFSGHGFGIGPAAGEAVAELAAGRTPMADLAAFRVDRFG